MARLPLIIIICTASVHAAVHQVAVGGDVQAAIDAAASGDTVQLAAGTYHGQLTVDKSLTLLGAGPLATTLDADGSGSGIVVTGDVLVTVRDLSVSNGSATRGGGLDIEATEVVLERVQVRDCAAGRGGGIYARESRLRLSDVVIAYCRATTELVAGGGKGGALYLLYTPVDGAAQINRCAFFGNYAQYGAAMRAWTAEAELRGCHFFANRGRRQVLDITESSSVEMVDCLVHDNQSLSEETIAWTYGSDGAVAYLTVAGNRSIAGAGYFYVDPFARLSLWNTAGQANNPDSPEMNPEVTFAGVAFSTPPPGHDLAAVNAGFASGPAGDFYLSATAGAGALLGTGVATSPLLPDTPRQCIADGTGAADPTNIGYCYPVDVAGAFELPSDSWAPRARGVGFLTYELQESAHPNFSQVAQQTVLGSLAEQTTALTVAEPAVTPRFFRLRGHGPAGATLTVSLVTEQGQALAAARVDLLSAATLSWRGTVTTDASGQAVFDNLPAGSYTLLGPIAHTSQAPTYLGSTLAAESAGTVTIQPRGSLTATLTAVAGGRIAGRVQTDGAPLPGLQILAYDSSGNLLNGAVSDAAGDYEIGGLAPGTYRLSAGLYPETDTVWWPNGSDFDTGQEVTIAGTETQTANFSAFAPLTSISGTVSVPDGAKAYQVAVVLYDSLTYDEVDFIYADADGHFEVFGPPASYVISAGEGGNLVIAWSDELLVDLVSVTGVDLTLVYGGTISGTVTDQFLEPVSTVYVDFYRIVSGSPVYVDSAQTDGLGEYLSPYLAPGNYYMQVYGSPLYSDVWYVNASSVTGARALPVTVFQDLSNIDVRVQLQ